MVCRVRQVRNHVQARRLLRVAILVANRVLPGRNARSGHVSTARRVGRWAGAAARLRLPGSALGRRVVVGHDAAEPLRLTVLVHELFAHLTAHQPLARRRRCWAAHCGRRKQRRAGAMRNDAQQHARRGVGGRYGLPEAATAARERATGWRGGALRRRAAPEQRRASRPAKPRGVATTGARTRCGQPLSPATTVAHCHIRRSGVQRASARARRGAHGQGEEDA